MMFIVMIINQLLVVYHLFDKILEFEIIISY